MVDTDRITGAAKEFGGKVQGAVGDLTGSRRDSVEGRARAAAGQAETVYGQAKDAARDAAEHVADTARDIGGKIRDTVGGLVGSDDVEHRARRAQGAAEEHFDRARRAVRRAADDAADDVSDYAGDAYARGGHDLRRATREVSHQVAEFPLASLLIAGAVGF
ncbi:CsbD family protein, partial [Methylobacterium sp. C33D]